MDAILVHQLRTVVINAAKFMMIAASEIVASADIAMTQFLIAYVHAKPETGSRRQSGGQLPHFLTIVETHAAKL
jgi:hypothetical protein